MAKAKDISGQRFGRWVAIKRSENKTSNGAYCWICECDCGNIKEVGIGHLQRGNSQSCGCLASEKLDELIKSKGGDRHDYKGQPVYVSWTGMLTRARSENLKNYEDVGVCPEWDPKQGGGFLKFLEDMGVPEEGQSLNRINGAKIYSKETCEWADRSLQGYDQKISVRNKTGRVGVHKTKTGKYRAKITKNKDSIFLGEFESFEEACKARTKAEIEYFGFSKE